jgi:hypothetical protein
MLSNKAKYTPKARPLNDDPNFWGKGLKGLGDWLESDLYEKTQALVKRFTDTGAATTSAALQTLRQTATWGTLPQISRFSA